MMMTQKRTYSRSISCSAVALTTAAPRACVPFCRKRDGEEAIEQEKASKLSGQSEREAEWRREREKDHGVEEGGRKRVGRMLVIGEERVRGGWAREKTATMYRSTGWWAASWLLDSEKPVSWRTTWHNPQWYVIGTDVSCPSGLRSAISIHQNSHTFRFSWIASTRVFHTIERGIKYNFVILRISLRNCSIFVRGKNIFVVCVDVIQTIYGDVVTFVLCQGRCSM